MEQNDQQKKKHIPAEQFCKNSCKLNIKNMGDYLEAAYHEELLEGEQLSNCNNVANCQECNNVLC